MSDTPTTIDPITDPGVRHLLVAGLCADRRRAVAICNPQGRLIWANDALRTMTGHAPDQVLGQSVAELMRGQAGEGVVGEQIDAAIDNGSDLRLECPLVCLDGRRLTLDLSLTPVRPTGQRLDGFLLILEDVTAQVRVRKHRQAILRSAVAGLVLQGEDGRIVDCNPQAERLMDLTRDELTGRVSPAARWNAVREDRSPLPREEFPSMRTLRTGVAQRGVVMGILRPNGERRWLEVNTELVLGVADDERAVVSSFVDITTRKKSEAILAEAIEAFPEGFVIYDDEDRLVICNSMFRQNYGRSAAIIERGVPFETVVRYGVAQGQYPQAGDTAQSQEDWVQLRLKAHRDADTDLLVQLDGDRWLQIRERRTSEGYTVGVRSDVTHLKRAQHDLQMSQFKLQSLFDLSPVGIVLTRLDSGDFVDCNQSLLTMLGYARNEIAGLNYWAVTPELYREQERAQVHALRENGRYGPYEKQMIRRDGSTVPVLANGLTIRDFDGSTLVWSIVQDITQRKTMEAALEAAARTDRLTGLANRATLTERLEQAVLAVKRDPAQRFCVLFLDFDRFKMINDTLGHQVGDRLLCDIADRLRRTLRATDFAGDGHHGNVVARLGGDEFVMLLIDVTDTSAAQAVARRVLDVLSRSYTVNGHEIHSTASIGIVMGDEHTPNADSLLRDADIAMYEAKQAGRGRAEVFNPQMHLRLTRRHEVETCLRHAIGTTQLSLVYQPIFDLESGAIVSVEALARWQHPQLGVVSPGEFIPIAEDSGLIVPLGEWALREACRQFMVWRREDAANAPESISVNLSRVQMAPAEALRALLLDVLAQSGMPAHCLQLEVTEREVMRDPVASRRLMNDLRELGVRLAMDDFGTGTSSLGCLRDFPFDTIKIDRSFLNELESNADVLALVHATLTLLENLGRASVAEGVESAAQLAVLQSLGCRYAQGYHLSRPLAAADLLDRVRKESARA